MDEPIDLPRGWFGPGDIEFYRWIYSELVPIEGETVEIGVYRGRSLMSVADIILSKRIRVSCIDLFQPFLEDKATDRFLQFVKMAQRFEIRDQLSILIGDSVQMAAAVPNKLDFVFLDDDHSYEHVVAEIAAWEPRIRRGGWIGGHDYPDFPGVARAVNEHYRKVQCRLDSSIWLTQVLR